MDDNEFVLQSLMAKHRQRDDRFERGLELLARGKSSGEIAKACSCTTRTVYNWRKMYTERIEAYRQYYFPATAKELAKSSRMTMGDAPRQGANPRPGPAPKLDRAAMADVVRDLQYPSPSFRGRPALWTPARVHGLVVEIFRKRNARIARIQKHKPALESPSRHTTARALERVGVFVPRPLLTSHLPRRTKVDRKILASINDDRVKHEASRDDWNTKTYPEIFAKHTQRGAVVFLCGATMAYQFAEDTVTTLYAVTAPIPKSPKRSGKRKPPFRSWFLVTPGVTPQILVEFLRRMIAEHRRKVVLLIDDLPALDDELIYSFRSENLDRIELVLYERTI